MQATAQEAKSGTSPVPRLGFYAGYLALVHTGPPTFYNFNGFNALNHDGSPAGFDLGILWTMNRLMAIRGDFSGSYNQHTGVFSVPCGQQTCAQSSSLNPHVYGFMAGPEFRIRSGSRVMPFAYTLLGAVHTTATFNTSGPLGTLSQDTSASGFSFAAGGGLSFRISRRVSSRVSADYSPAFFGHLDTGARQIVHYVRIGAGIVIH